MPDQGKFHYYDQPPIFTVNLRVSGTASLTIAAETREEAKAKARDDFEADLEDCDDVDISYISEHPTRMYLITRPESPVRLERPSSCRAICRGNPISATAIPMRGWATRFRGRPQNERPIPPHGGPAFTQRRRST